MSPSQQVFTYEKLVHMKKHASGINKVQKNQVLEPLLNFQVYLSAVSYFLLTLPGAPSRMQNFF